MFNAIQIYRVARYLHLKNVPVLPRLLRKSIQYLHGSYLPPECEIGEGVELGYGGLGVIIHPEARVGRNVVISPQVTLGGRSSFEGAPTVGDGVVIGAGAKILGPIHLGDSCRVGANAVVIRDVPAGATVAGVPAKVIDRVPPHRARQVRS